MLNFLITNLQKYEPHTCIFDLGGSFESLTQLFGGSYVRVGFESDDFRINPFSLPPSKENLDFLALFVKVLLQGARQSSTPPRNGISTSRSKTCTPLPRAKNARALAATLDAASPLVSPSGRAAASLVSSSTTPRTRSRFPGFSVSTSRDEPIPGDCWNRCSSTSCTAPTRLLPIVFQHVFKSFFIDEAWVFLKNPSIQNYWLKRSRRGGKTMPRWSSRPNHSMSCAARAFSMSSSKAAPPRSFLPTPIWTGNSTASSFTSNETEVETHRNSHPEAAIADQNPGTRESREPGR